jgi:hypothetical protein
MQELPRVPRTGAAKKGAPPKGQNLPEGGRAQEPRAHHEGQRQWLPDLRREVHAHMPKGVATSDRMDDWLSVFSSEGIEIVDPSSKIKVVEKGPGEVTPEE